MGGSCAGPMAAPTNRKLSMLRKGKNMLDDKKNGSLNPPIHKTCGTCGATAAADDDENRQRGSASLLLLLRCTKCRSQYYCSKVCQKKDWKRHKKVCQFLAQRAKAVQAWNELEQIVENTAPDQAARAFCGVADELSNLRARQGKKESNQESNMASNEQSCLIQRKLLGNEPPSRRHQGNLGLCPLPVDARNVDATELARSATKDTTINETTISTQTQEKEGFHVLFSSSGVASNKSRPRNDAPVVAEQNDRATSETSTKPVSVRKPRNSGIKGDSCFDFYLEQLPHLACYQLELCPKSDSDAQSIELQYWSVKVSTNDSREVSIVSLYNSLCKQHLVFQLPGCVNESIDSASVLNGRLSLRLSFEALGEPTVETKRTSTEKANALSCSGCGSALLCREESENAPRIERLLPLPSGLWDDMSDYLVCFEGQASTDFTSSCTEAQRGLVLEDGTVLVYHFDDIAPNLQVLAIPGYGEGDGDDNTASDSSRAVPLTRGNRSWSDAIGGATVTCSCCCLVLGVAPIDLLDTVRLYKHRVESCDKVKLSSVLSFCVHSMIRYAESKAIFSFLVRDQANARSAFVLQLIGWEGKVAREYKDDATWELAWSRLARVLYEQRNDIPEPEFMESPMRWTQKGDWCCPPNGPVPTRFQEETKTDRTTDLPLSSVSLWLDTEEWSSLNEELKEASAFYSSELVSAAFLAKNGRLPESGTPNGLAAVFLQ